MDKVKEIEEMAKLLFDKYSDKLCQDCGSQTSCKELGYDDCGICSSIARDLQDEGYGNVKQAVNEFTEKLKQSLIDKYQSLNVLAHNSFLALPAILDVVKEVEQELYGED